MSTSTEEKRLGTWLFNPFARIAGWQSLLFGIAAILAAGYIGSLGNTHFDGVLDVHTGMPAPRWVFLSEGLIDWLSLGSVLLVFGKIVSKTQFRPLDLMGTQAMARWPTIITALVTLPGAFRRFTLYLTVKLQNPSGETPINFADAAIFFTAMLVVVLMACWFVVLAYRSYTISCKVKGRKAIWTFVAGILLAEILSKIVIIFIFRRVAGTAIG